MTKKLFVASAVQAILLEEVFIHELKHGFWKNHRPMGHGDAWTDVQVIVSEDDNLGPEGWTPPRTYNFLNLDFFNPNEERLVQLAKTVKPSSISGSVKKELIELGQIVGGRLKNKKSTAVKLFRGNHAPGTSTVSSAKARAAGASLIEAAAAITPPAETTVRATIPGVKRTVVKSANGYVATRIKIR